MTQRKHHLLAKGEPDGRPVGVVLLSFAFLFLLSSAQLSSREVTDERLPSTLFYTHTQQPTSNSCFLICFLFCVQCAIIVKGGSGWEAAVDPAQLKTSGATSAAQLTAGRPCAVGDQVFIDYGAAIVIYIFNRFQVFMSFACVAYVCITAFMLYATHSRAAV